MIPMKQTTKRPSDETLVNMRKTMTLREIADTYEVTQGTVNRWLKPLRDEGRIKPRVMHSKTKRPTDETLAKLYADHTAKEISEIYDVSVNTVRTWIQNARKREERSAANVQISENG